MSQSLQKESASEYHNFSTELHQSNPIKNVSDIFQHQIHSMLLEQSELILLEQSIVALHISNMNNNSNQQHLAQSQISKLNQKHKIEKKNVLSNQGILNKEQVIRSQKEQNTKQPEKSQESPENFTQSKNDSKIEKQLKLDVSTNKGKFQYTQINLEQISSYSKMNQLSKKTKSIHSEFSQFNNLNHAQNLILNAQKAKLLEGLRKRWSDKAKLNVKSLQKAFELVFQDEVSTCLKVIKNLIYQKVVSGILQRTKSVLGFNKIDKKFIDKTQNDELFQSQNKSFDLKSLAQLSQISNLKPYQGKYKDKILNQKVEGLIQNLQFFHGQRLNFLQFLFKDQLCQKITKAYNVVSPMSYKEYGLVEINNDLDPQKYYSLNFDGQKKFIKNINFLNEQAPGLDGLIELDLSFCQITNEELDQLLINIRKFKSLRILNLNKNSFTRITQQQLHYLKPLHQVESKVKIQLLKLNLNQNQLEAETIGNLVRFSNQCAIMGNSIAIEFNVDDLYLKESNLTFKQLIESQNLKNIKIRQRLSLKNCSLTDQDWKLFIKNLDNLSLPQNIDFSNNMIQTIQINDCERLSNQMKTKGRYFLKLFLIDNPLSTQSKGQIMKFYHSLSKNFIFHRLWIISLQTPLMYHFEKGNIDLAHNNCNKFQLNESKHYLNQKIKYMIKKKQVHFNQLVQMLIQLFDSFILNLHGHFNKIQDHFLNSHKHFSNQISPDYKAQYKDRLLNYKKNLLQQIKFWFYIFEQERLAYEKTLQKIKANLCENFFTKKQDYDYFYSIFQKFVKNPCGEFSQKQKYKEYLLLEGLNDIISQEFFCTHPQTIKLHLIQMVRQQYPKLIATEEIVNQMTVTAYVKSFFFSANKESQGLLFFMNQYQRPEFSQMCDLSEQEIQKSNFLSKLDGLARFQLLMKVQGQFSQAQLRQLGATSAGSFYPSFSEVSPSSMDSNFKKQMDEYSNLLLQSNLFVLNKSQTEIHPQQFDAVGSQNSKIQNFISFGNSKIQNSLESDEQQD